jgi:hypothetical protein
MAVFVQSAEIVRKPGATAKVYRFSDTFAVIIRTGGNTKGSI